jgi:ribokinase
MTTPPPRIAVVGSTMIDLVAYTTRIPAAGETLVGQRFQMGFGGKGANQAVMARLLGAEVWMVNSIGDDPYGPMTRANLESFGIDTGFVHAVPGSSGVAPIWVEPDGTNRIIIIPGANLALSADQAVAAIETMPAPRVVIGQFEIPQDVTTAAFEVARARGAVTILNPAPAAAAQPRLLAATDWIVPNEIEFELLFGGTGADDAAIAAAARRLQPRLVVTLGAAGCAVAAASGGEIRRHPTPVVPVVDTTGAGDAFVGALAYALASGLGETIALRLANLCAAESVTKPGTQASFPTPARSRELLALATA